MAQSAPRSRMVCAALMLSAAPLAAQLPQPPQVLLGDLIPADLPTAQVVLSTDTMRAYTVSPAGEIWLYNRAAKTRTKIADGESWDPSLAAMGTALAYTKAGERKPDHAVWVLTLDPKTGLAVGTERRASTGSGDAPSISPDGKWLAFARDDSTGVGQSVVVVPIGGGAERVLLKSLPSSVGFIRWTPDGKTLFVGVNPLVACDPGWSCLALRPELERPNGSIRRVPVAGGPATVVAAASAVWPGLSPDGTILVYADTGKRQLVVADPSGKRLLTFAPPTGTIQGWIGKATLLVSNPRSRASLQRFSVTDGGRGGIVETVDRLLDPALSPDGKQIAMVQCVLAQCTLRILGMDGALRREVSFTESYLGGSSWSPDQHWIAALTRGAGPQTAQINVIEALTGRITRVGELPMSNGLPTLVWNADSRALTMSVDRMVGNERHVTFHRFGLDGQHQELRDLGFAENQGNAMTIDEKTALVSRTSKPQTDNGPPDITFSLLPLDAAGSERPFTLPPAYYFQATFTPRRDWIALRTFLQDGGDESVFEVLRADGSGRRTVTLPFTAGFEAPLLLANGEQMILRDNASASQPANVYLVAVATGHSTKLFSIPAGQRMSQFGISADGKTMFFVTLGTAAPQFLAIDPMHFAQLSRP